MKAMIFCLQSSWDPFNPRRSLFDCIHHLYKPWFRSLIFCMQSIYDPMNPRRSLHITHYLLADASATPPVCSPAPLQGRKIRNPENSGYPGGFLIFRPRWCLSGRHCKLSLRHQLRRYQRQHHCKIASCRWLCCLYEWRHICTTTRDQNPVISSAPGKMFDFFI